MHNLNSIQKLHEINSKILNKLNTDNNIISQTIRKEYINKIYTTTKQLEYEYNIFLEKIN